MKYLLLLILLYPSLTFARPMYGAPINLRWDAVTKDIAGNDITQVRYRLYRKFSQNSYVRVSETPFVNWTWDYPIVGKYTFKVTAVANNLESDASAELPVDVKAGGKQPYVTTTTMILE